MMSEVRTIVIDSGAYLTRVGLSGDDVPVATFRTLVGRPKKGSDLATADPEDSVFVGLDAHENRATLDLSYPLENYTVTNRKDMDEVWQYCFLDILGCDCGEYNPVMLTDGPVDAELKTKARAKMAEAMFETYNVPSFYVAMQPFLALKSLEKNTGLVLDIGDSMISSVPVVDGAVVTSGVSTMDIVSGRHLTKYLMKMLNEQVGVSITDPEIATAIKEKIGYLSWDYDVEFSLADSITRDYTLPDGQVIAVGTERFRCAEPLFKTSLLGGDDDKGIHKMVHRSIQQCDEPVQGALYDCIVTAGGSSCLNNLADRLEKEIRALIPDEARTKVLTPPTRAWSAWLGGSLLADSENFAELAVSKQEYQENGVEIVNKKCTN